jgi:Family of unknown function (DUF6325)
MAYGPVELLVIQADKSAPVGVIVEGLRELIELDAIRIIDLAFVQTDASGRVTASELADLDEAAYKAVGPLIAEVTGLVSEGDLVELGDALEPSSEAMVLLIEHRWPQRLDDGARESGSRVVLHLRVPRETVVEVLAARRLGRRHEVHVTTPPSATAKRR